jgi:putative flavoprotein involved in K+ transport
MPDALNTVVVVGGGQAGLAVSHELTHAGVEHVVLERGRVAQTWRRRWDSFCLVTPNWSLQLPDHAYSGADPDGFLARDEIVDYLEGYAASFQAPVNEGVDVTALAPGSGSRFRLSTNAGEIEADTVVLTSGAYQRAHRPAAAEALPSRVHSIDAEGYQRPASLPPGGVLIVGSGQTGCQLAEELHESGREVFLACGRAPWVPRRIGDRDVFWWMVETGFADTPLSSLQSPAARLIANPQASGHGRGHDLHFRSLQRLGVRLLGHFTGVESGHARFAADLADSVGFGDARWGDFMNLVRKTCESHGIPVPDLPVPEPFRADAPISIPLARIGTVIFTSGFRPAYRRWVDFPAFDEMGFPLQEEGASTVVPGLYFVGVHFLRKRKSSLLLGVGEDARLVADKVADRNHSGRTAGAKSVSTRDRPASFAR